MASAKTATVRRSRADGQRLVAKYERSGLTRKAFCARESISISALDYWRTRLGTESTRTGFVELTPGPIASGGWDIELELGAGVVLRLRRGD